MPKAILFLIPLALVALEGCRLQQDEVVRLRQTWEFATAEGPMTVSDVVELRQSPAIPYLPGGEVGQYRTIGRLPVSFSISGTKYSISSEPMTRLENGVRAGRANPPVSMEGLRNGYTTGFVRRLRKAKATIVIPVEKLPDWERQQFRVAKEHGQSEPLPKTVSLTEFEAAHPGFRLVRITYTVTDELADH